MRIPANTATLLTWFRIALIPAVIGVFYLPESVASKAVQNILATSFFIAAALTDWLDGYIARKFNQSSAFGAFLDPVADKLMVCAALVMLIELNRVDVIIGFLIIGRELSVSALREWMAGLGKRTSVAVNSLGKIKTIAQMVAIPLLLFDQVLLGLFHTHKLGYALLVVAAALTVVSMFYYFQQARKALGKE